MELTFERVVEQSSCRLGERRLSERTRLRGRTATGRRSMEPFLSSLISGNLKEKAAKDLNQNENALVRQNYVGP